MWGCLVKFKIVTSIKLKLIKFCVYVWLWKGNIFSLSALLFREGASCPKASLDSASPQSPSPRHQGIGLYSYHPGRIRSRGRTATPPNQIMESSFKPLDATEVMCFQRRLTFWFGVKLHHYVIMCGYVLLLRIVEMWWTNKTNKYRLPLM